MKSSLAVFALGIAALIVQGALARTLSPPWCPDFAWLIVVVAEYFSPCLFSQLVSPSW